MCVGKTTTMADHQSHVTYYASPRDKFSFSKKTPERSTCFRKKHMLYFMQILYAVTLHFTRKINTSVINVINARSIHIHRCLKSSSNEAHSFSPRNMGLTVAFSDVFFIKWRLWRIYCTFYSNCKGKSNVMGRYESTLRR